MIGCWQVAKALSRMSLQTMATRLRRSASRILSPKRFLATLGAILFVALYVIKGILVVVTRKPADPAELTLWLSGAMAVDGMFHFVRAAWQEPEARLGLSQAESLWIACAPISNPLLILRRLSSVVQVFLSFGYRCVRSCGGTFASWSAVALSPHGAPR